MEDNVLEKGLSSESYLSKLSNQDLAYLKTTATWTKFLAILGFIFSLLFILGGISAAFLLGSFTGQTQMPVIFGPALGGFYSAIGFVFVILSLYLNRFSNRMTKVWHTNSSVDLSEAFRNLRNYFRFTGWLILGFIILYVVFIVMLGTGAATGIFGRFN